jgi:hypothetical protein
MDGDHLQARALNGPLSESAPKMIPSKTVGATYDN